jgi:NAD(P)-dependent dehydrogenase (short-subunit alcohol dehydrogenase family)
MKTGRTYVVLGASGGIGSALCRRLAEEGATVIAAARDRAKLQERLAGVPVVESILDPTRPEEIERCLREAVERHGPLSGAANCIGSLLLKPAHVTTDEEWSRTLALNLTTCFHLLQAAVRIFPPDGGSIVFVASAAALVGLANHEAIAAAKGGVIGLCLAAAASYAPRGIRVNCVAPGLTRTPLTARITGSEASMRATTAMHALGRIGEAEEVASGLAWLLDPEQGWVTGQVIGIDGGLARVRPKS